MPIVRIEHSVPSFEKWKQAFDSDPADRKGSGVRRYQILRLQDDPNYVMIDLEFDTISEAQAFLTAQRSGSGAVQAKRSCRTLAGALPRDLAEVKEL